jgi:DNA polymerase I-like protein with 3'-5' exonuclease and polymerase domains
MKICIDVETTTKAKGHAFHPENKLISYAYNFNNTIIFKYYTDPDFRMGLGNCLDSASEFIGFAFKFDLHWICRVGTNYNPNVRVWDCQLAEFILNNQRGAFGSLDAALETYGIPLKKDKVKEYWEAGIDTPDIPVEILEEYNKYDVQATLELYSMQQQLMTDKQKTLVYLLGEDLKCLQQAEFNGVKWNAAKAKDKVEAITAEVNAINEALNSYLPPITHGSFNWNSGDHLSCLIYGGVINFDYSIPTEATYKSGPRKGEAYTKNTWHTESVSFPQLFKPLEGTELAKTRGSLDAPTRFYQTDYPTLSQLKTRVPKNRELITLLNDRSAKTKVSEMILSIEKKRTDLGWEDDMIHAQFNQNVAITGRLSSNAP